MSRRSGAAALMVGVLLLGLMPAATAAAVRIPTTVELQVHEPATAYDIVTFLAIVRPSPTDGGTVTLVNHAFGVGEGVDEAPVTPNGAAHLATPHGLPQGSATFFVVYNGSVLAAPSTSPDVTFEVVDDRTPVTVTLVSDVNPSLRSEPVHLHTTVSPASAAGQIQLLRADTPSILLPPATVGPDGKNDFEWTPSSTADWQIKACFLGSSEVMEGCSPTLVQSTFAYATTTTLVIDPPAIYQDEDVTLKVHVDPPPGTAVDARVGPSEAQGWYVGIDGATGDGQVTVAAFDLRQDLGLGHHDLIAFFPGSPSTDASQSDAAILDIVTDATTTTVGLDPPVIRGGALTTIRVAVAPPPAALPLVGVLVHHPVTGDWLKAVDLDETGHGSIVFDSTGWPDGTYPVTATFGGTDHLASSTATATLTIDSTLPISTGPSFSLVASAVTIGHARARLAWSGTDTGTGIHGFDLDQQTDSGTWQRIGTGLTVRSLDRTLTTGHRYRFRVRATDGAGNVGAWSMADARMLSSISERSSKVRHTPSWRRATSTVYWGGGALSSSGTGAKVSLRTTASSVALISRIGPLRGSAMILVDGAYAATIDLHATKAAGPKIVWTRNWATSKGHTVTVMVIGTKGHPSIVVDGFLTLG